MTTRAAHAETVANARAKVFDSFANGELTMAQFNADIDALIAAVRHEAGADRLPRQAHEVQQAETFWKSRTDNPSICSNCGLRMFQHKMSDLHGTVVVCVPAWPIEAGADALLLLSDHPHEDGADNGCGPDQAAPTTETYREEIPIGPASGYDDPPEDEQTDQARIPRKCPKCGEIMECRQKRLDSEGAWERSFKALEAERDRYQRALNIIASWGEGETVRSSFDEPGSALTARAALVGYRGNPSVSEASGSAQSAAQDSSSQPDPLSPPEDP